MLVQSILLADRSLAAQTISTQSLGEQLPYHQAPYNGVVWERAFSGSVSYASDCDPC